MTIPTIAVIGEKPAATPEGRPIDPAMRIFNTTRPLWGDLNWSTDGRPTPFRNYGWWFAAVHPDSPDWQTCYDNNARMDACELIFVTEDEAFAAGAATVRSWNAGKAEKYRLPEDELEKHINDPVGRYDMIMRGLAALSSKRNWL